MPPARFTMDDVTRDLRNELFPELPATREIMNIQIDDAALIFISS